MTFAQTTARDTTSPRRAAMAVMRAVGRVWTAPDRIFLASMAVMALVLRVPRLGIRYWGDEAISVGIASRPLLEIPHYLRFDGSPPLYYVLLHFWMRLWGTSEVATHSLSLLISLSAIPAAWWCAKALFGPRAARPAALLASVFPYLAYYGTETRMYVLLGVLSTLALVGWVRALQAPGPGLAGRWLALAVVASVAVLYTHNWGLFLVAVCVGVGLACAWATGEWVRLRRTMIYGGATAVAYLPWLPSFWWQLHYTGAPWSPRPSVVDLGVDPFNVSFSAAWPLALVCLVVACVAIRSALRRGEPLDVGSEDGRGANWLVGSPLGVAGVVVVATGLLGWLASQVVNSWAPRYLGVAVVPAVVVMAGAFAATRLGRRCLPFLAVVLAATALPVLIDPPAAADGKSNVAAADAAMAPQLAPGDLVITTAMSELPVIAYYLPAGLRFATPIGLVADPSVVDWQHLSARLSAADPTTGLAALLQAVPAGGHVLLINPLTWGSTEAPPQFQATVEAEGIAVSNDVLGDPSYTVVATLRPADAGGIANPVEAILLRKTG
jgi:uncharacterized membrane protein